MRRAELVMALVMATFSLYVMWKSAELPIGWIPNAGPGGGAFPFWLAVGMLLCCVAIVVRWVRGTSPLSRAKGRFMDVRTLRLFAINVGALVAMLGLFYVIGVYGALPLYLIFYMRFLGRHSWRLTMAVAVATPIITFFFFEIALNIFLPKGFTEPLFYPLYDFFL